MYIMWPFPCVLFVRMRRLGRSYVDCVCVEVVGTAERLCPVSCDSWALAFGVEAFAADDDDGIYSTNVRVQCCVQSKNTCWI